MRDLEGLGERRKKRQRYECEARRNDDRITPLHDVMVRRVTAGGVASLTVREATVLMRMMVVVVVVGIVLGIVMVVAREHSGVRLRVYVASRARRRPVIFEDEMQRQRQRLQGETDTCYGSHDPSHCWVAPTVVHLRARTSQSMGVNNGIIALAGPTTSYYKRGRQSPGGRPNAVIPEHALQPTLVR